MDGRIEDGAEERHAPNSSDLIGVISIMDLASELPFPNPTAPAVERAAWGATDLRTRVDRAEYRHFFIVHELEAWLLTMPSVFDKRIEKALISRLPDAGPETINGNKPPSKLLSELYLKYTEHGYDRLKRQTSRSAFPKIDIDAAYAKCPSLKAILDEMLLMAKAAGL